MVWEDMWFEEFQDGGNIGNRNRTILKILNLYAAPIKFLAATWILDGTILAILNLYNAPMPPIKFRLNLTSGLGGDVV